jgi:hypothetical protein
MVAVSRFKCAKTHCATVGLRVVWLGLGATMNAEPPSGSFNDSVTRLGPVWRWCVVPQWEGKPARRTQLMGGTVPWVHQGIALTERGAHHHIERVHAKVQRALASVGLA